MQHKYTVFTEIGMHIKNIPTSEKKILYCKTEVSVRKINKLCTTEVFSQAFLYTIPKGASQTKADEEEVPLRERFSVRMRMCFADRFNKVC